MRALAILMLLGLLTACDEAGDDDSAAQDDDDAADDDDDDAADDDDDGPAGLAPLSDGECPEITESGDYAMDSAGEHRPFTVLLPDDLQDGAPLMFFFHGLAPADYNPGPETAQALGLQGMANEHGAIIVVPEARLMNFFGDVFLWDVMDGDDHDVVLYDDLRTCMVGELGADITRVTATGFSSGALFTTILARDRADTLAAIVEMSGGSDMEAPLVDPIATYGTPVNNLPVLLFSGGTNDSWPEGIGILNFEEATNTLEGKLADDEFFVVRCKHDYGHTVTQQELGLAEDWLFTHVYSEASPFEQDGIEGFGEWCQEISEPKFAVTS